MKKVFLHLANGSVLEGFSFGYYGESEGEVVFSTGMTGYVESLTDPSFAGQILTFTYPLIGNYGIPRSKYLNTNLMSNFESEKIWVKGVIVSSFSEVPSHCDAFQSISEWLKSQKTPGIYGIDTRALTQQIRESGVIQGKISTRKNKTTLLPNTLLNTVSTVSIKEVVQYKPKKTNGKHIAVIDCGIKHGILRELLKIGYAITRVPWDVNPLDVTKRIDGVICSNGPGDPKDALSTVENVRKIIDKNIPFLGICLGHQLLSLAIGADTYKMKYGHRGLNQPCLDLKTNKAYVTSQNHGFAVSRKNLPKGFEEWFVNLNDNTVEGIRHKTKNIKSVQFHPEGCPGPFDTNWIYNFI